ncbi:MAG TPA: pseudouridine synthase [Planctomycetota bacterium]|nr:pseudouridine synthase [Planctomycetota bacterium]
MPPQRRTSRGNRVTLARALSKLGVLSRTQAAAAIRQGRVALDGKPERDPDRWIDPDRGRISLDGAPVLRQETLCYLLHKPAGVVTTRSDERGRRTVYDLLPADLPWLFPVGRLDQDSSGLLLLSNDTRLGETVSGPESRLPKTYDVTFDAPLSHDAADRFRAGMTLADGTQLLPAKVQFPPESDRTRCHITLTEGKNRQIRRMAEACGRTVVRLHRLTIGPLRLGKLGEGELRPLTAAEHAALKTAVRARRQARRSPPAG